MVWLHGGMCLGGLHKGKVGGKRPMCASTASSFHLLRVDVWHPLAHFHEGRAGVRDELLTAC